MTVYSYAQLEQLWINNGGSKSLAPIAAAIAEAESAGKSDATNATDNGGTQTSWGLWQISNGTHNQPVANILDPNVNAQQAVAKYNAAGGWSPWGTYTSGAYAAFLSGKTPPDPNVPTTTGTTTTGTSSPGTASTSTCVTGQIFGYCPLTKSEARALIGGLLIIAGGMVMLPGVILLAAFAFRATGGQAAAGQASGTLEHVPVYGHAIRYTRDRAQRADPSRR